MTSAERWIEAQTDSAQNFRGIPQPIFYQGRAYVFAVTTTGAVQMYTDGGSWINLAGVAVSSVGVAQLPNTMHTQQPVGVAALMNTGDIQVLYINPASRSSTPFGTLADTPPDTTWVGSPVLALAEDQQTLEAFTLDSKGQMYNSTQQSPAGSWNDWSSLGSPAPGLSTEAELFAVYLAVDNSLRIVALGADDKMYQLSRDTGGQWGQWQVVGEPESRQLPNEGPATTLVNGPAASYCADTRNPIYAGYNSAAEEGECPLVFAGKRSPSPSWGPLDLEPDQYPMPTAVPLMINQNGIPLLIWVAASGQTWAVQEKNAPQEFWGPPKLVGKSIASFSGYLGGDSNPLNNNVVLAQRANRSIYYILYTP